MIEPMSVCELEAGNPTTTCPGSKGWPKPASKDHGETGARSHLQDQLDRQQRDDSERHRAGRKQHPDQIPHTRPHHGNVWLQRVGIDHRSHSIGGIVESIDELKTRAQSAGRLASRKYAIAEAECGTANRSPSSCDAAHAMPPTRTTPKIIIGVLPCFRSFFAGEQRLPGGASRPRISFVHVHTLHTTGVRTVPK